LPTLLDELMKEDAFYDRLREGFNDIFLTVGLDGNPEATVLSYEHFTKTRLWTQKYDLSHVPEKDRQKARYKLDADYRKALLGEPMKLVEHIVRNDRPFTEIVTADYILVTPFTARGYGIFDEVKAQAKDPIPATQASECVVCHKTIDPVAGCFQDYYDFDGVYGRRKQGWYKDMFEAGLEGEKLPPAERWRALQWLGERTAKDPRFAVA